MKATIRTLAVLLAVGFSASFAAAQNPYFQRPMTLQAPDACGPGLYFPNCCGSCWGPVYCVRPCWEPFNGARPPLSGPGCGGEGGNLAFPSHAFCRSPRDFFMVDETPSRANTFCPCPR